MVKKLLILLVSWPLFCNGQIISTSIKKGETISSDTYGRKTLSFLVTSEPGTSAKYSSWIEKYAYINYADVQSRFDKIALPVTYINLPGSTASARSGEISQRKLPNHILAQIWSRTPTGNLGFDYLTDRTMYNATDWEKMVAESTFRGSSSILDEAETLIQNSYFIVMEPIGIQTLEDKYDEQDAKNRNTALANNKPFIPTQRTQEGFSCEFRVNIYHLDFDELVSYNFFENIWVDETTPEENREDRIKQFDMYNFPVSFSFEKMTDEITSSQPKGTRYNSQGQQSTKLTQEQLFEQLMQKGWKAGLSTLESVFLLSQSISNANPIKAKLGVKEGVDPGQRYHVYEYKSSNTGQKKKKLVGVLQSTAKRPSLAEIQRGDRSTTFIQTYGRKLDIGMLVEEHQDKGIGITLMGGTHAMAGIQVRAEANISTILGKKGIHLGTGLRLGIGIGGQKKYSDDYVAFYTSDNIILESPYLFTRIQGDLLKDIQINRFLMIQPGLGVGSSRAEYRFPNQAEETVNIVSQLYGAPTLSIGIAIAPFARFMVSGSYFLPIGMPLLSENVFALESFGNWEDLFPRRSGFSTQVGIQVDIF